VLIVYTSGRLHALANASSGTFGKPVGMAACGADQEVEPDGMAVQHSVQAMFNGRVEDALAGNTWSGFS